LLLQAEVVAEVHAAQVAVLAVIVPVFLENLLVGVVPQNQL
jgi:hypothetical protein